MSHGWPRPRLYWTVGSSEWGWSRNLTARKRFITARSKGWIKGCGVRVIIIGSGIGGLSAAIGLRRVGIEVTVYERAPELREVGAGISLWANALRALDYLGAGDAIRAAALALDQSELRADKGRLIQARFSGNAMAAKVGVSPFVAMIHRAELIGALAGLVPDAGRYGFECVSVQQQGQRVATRFANSHTDEADAVIGADGIKSTVRA